jgi:zinc transport system substrate-binding protein
MKTSCGRVALLAAATTTLLALAACGSGATGSGSDGRLRITASFYPLQYLAERIGGADVEVTSLTKPGAEPHDLELTPRDVAGLSTSSLVVYLKGFQPAVDDAVRTDGPKSVFDASPPADLSLTYTPIEGGQTQSNQTRSPDPHFWLDPVRLQAVASALATQMEQLAPKDAAAFGTNAAALHADLVALDSDLRPGLAHCQNKDLVTSHNAFGYLAQRYGLTQVGITGLTPEAEPNPRELAGVTAFVRQNQVRTIYYETLVSPSIADTVARETGARTEVLDPIEGLSSRSQGSTYLEVMRSNLRNLRQGQPCR